MPLDKKDENSNMAGVPVKISEKYKPPPVIYLPSRNIQPGPAFYEEVSYLRYQCYNNI